METNKNPASQRAVAPMTYDQWERAFVPIVVGVMMAALGGVAYALSVHLSVENYPSRWHYRFNALLFGTTCVLGVLIVFRAIWSIRPDDGGE